jgi:hypothetical protein
MMSRADSILWCVGGPLDGVARTVCPAGYELREADWRGLSGLRRRVWVFCWRGLRMGGEAERLDAVLARELGRRVS